jgi:hypothetical protein
MDTNMAWFLFIHPFAFRGGGDERERRDRLDYDEYSFM